MFLCTRKAYVGWCRARMATLKLDFNKTVESANYV